MITWLFRRFVRVFWNEYSHPPTETQWNMVQEEDAWEGIRVQLERIADALNKERSE